MRPLTYLVSPDDPRAPTQEVWEQLSLEERAHVIDALPSEFLLSPEDLPKGDLHYEARSRTRETLRGFFSRTGRKVYLACALPVYYPDEPPFAPDFMAVVGVETHPRMHWLVSHEKKGLDLVLEVHVAGDWRKDLPRNLERCARLGIHEYWVFDRERLQLSGWRLDEEGRYRQLGPLQGRYQSSVLGLELQVEGERLRFYHNRVPLLDVDERLAALERRLKQAEARLKGLEARRAELEQQRAGEKQRREEAEHRLAETLAELENLRGGQK